MNLKPTLIKGITALVLLFSFKLALAVVPATLNYQGHLTDSAGVPIDGPVNMVFSIYDIDTGGTVLWSDTRSVTIDQGVFSVELGGGLNPFPLGLFENPLWMGLTVAADAEMSPRRPLSSTAYSFKADDANTLEGVSASTLDQSSHVIDNANPHNVTAAQAGAADAAALSAHTSNIANPHSVTAAQTGAATSANFTAHTGDINAHHSRYTNTEAVNAMGAKSDANALNHDKYSNSNAVAAVLAADGAGSTLDADLLDGLQASEVIDAAQDEVRTPISSLPFTINASGSYYITGNLDGTGGGITINVDNVSIDLMGYMLDGSGATSGYGIHFSGRNHVTIKNGIIKDFPDAGIYQNFTTTLNTTVIDVTVSNNGHSAAVTNNHGINANGRLSRIIRCTADNNGNNGISTGSGAIVVQSAAYNNANDGIHVNNSATINESTAYLNGGNGIDTGLGAVVSNSTGYDNLGNGIDVNTGSTVISSTAFSNEGLYGIKTGLSGNVIDNTVYSNQNWGIYSSSGSQIKGNALYSNNVSNVVGQGGIYVYGDSRVIDNTLDGNRQNNIYISNIDNAVIANHVTDSTSGIHFNNGGNYYRDNTASGNTTAFSGILPSGAGDGGGNASF